MYQLTIIITGNLCIFLQNSGRVINCADDTKVQFGRISIIEITSEVIN